MDQQYPANSDAAREHVEYAKKHVQEPAINGGVKLREKSLWDQVREFFGLGRCETFRDYVSCVSDMTNRVYGAMDTLLGGRPVGGGGPTVPGARIAYSNYYNNPMPQAQAQNNVQQKLNAAYTYESLEFDTRALAEVVLMRMYELLGIYRAVSVGDLFDLAGVTDPGGYTNQKFGWKDISGARVVPFGNKYRIVGLPMPQQL
jgi:hypothetical protein